MALGGVSILAPNRDRAWRLGQFGRSYLESRTAFFDKCFSRVGVGDHSLWVDDVGIGIYRDHVGVAIGHFEPVMADSDGRFGRI